MDYYNFLTGLQFVVFNHIEQDIVVGTIVGILLGFAIVVMRRN